MTYLDLKFEMSVTKQATALNSSIPWNKTIPICDKDDSCNCIIALVSLWSTYRCGRRDYLNPHPACHHRPHPPHLSLTLHKLYTLRILWVFLTGSGVISFFLILGYVVLLFSSVWDPIHSAIKLCEIVLRDIYRKVYFSYRGMGSNYYLNKISNVPACFS